MELNKIKMPTADQLDELAELSFLSKYKLRSVEDITAHEKTLEMLKSELSDTEKIFEATDIEKRQAAENYKTYLRQMQSDYDFVLDKLKREREEIERAERDLQLEKLRENRQKSDYWGTDFARR